MFKLNKYKAWIYIALIFIILSSILYSFWFLYQNFYLPIGWADNSSLYQTGYTERINSEKLNDLFERVKEDSDKEGNQRELFACFGDNCSSVKEVELKPNLKCESSMGAGFGADCVWTVTEIHLDHEGDPDKNFMVYEAEEAVRPSYLSMKWPSISRCDAYQVYVSSEGEEWFSLGDVPSPSACPQTGKTVLGEYDVSGVDFKVKYIKIAKLYDNEGDDSLDTPSEVTLVGFTEKKTDNSAIRFCTP